MAGVTFCGVGFADAIAAAIANDVGEHPITARVAASIAFLRTIELKLLIGSAPVDLWGMNGNYADST